MKGTCPLTRENAMIRRGIVVEVVTALEEKVRMRALSPVVRGRDFPVVYVCAEAEWSDGRGETEGIPWPAESVYPVGAAATA